MKSKKLLALLLVLMLVSSLFTGCSYKDIRDLRNFSISDVFSIFSGDNQDGKEDTEEGEEQNQGEESEDSEEGKDEEKDDADKADENADEDSSDKDADEDSDDNDGESSSNNDNTSSDDKKDDGKKNDDKKNDDKNSDDKKNDDKNSDDKKNDDKKDDDKKEDDKKDDAGTDVDNDGKDEFVDKKDVENVNTETETTVVTDSKPAVNDDIKDAKAPGIKVQSGNGAEIDYSNTKDGYVMIRFTQSTDKKLKVQIKGPSTTYTYNLSAGAGWETYALSDGEGSYTVMVLQNVVDNKYAMLTSVSFTVKQDNEFAPFLQPNQYVAYNKAPNAVAKASSLCSGVSDPLKKVEKIYNYVVGNLSYDYDKAASVQSGYVPNLDSVLAAKKGICFDYASLMAGMLRSQDVPCKLVIGYAGDAYHAWISVYVEGQGWVDGAIFFNGSSWNRMDPTYASSSNKSKEIMDFIADGSNYSAKYIY